MPFKIEKGIRIYARNGKSNEISITLVEMQKGDSFLIPEQQRANVIIQAHRHKIKIACRKGRGENEEGLVRVWKLEP